MRPIDADALFCDGIPFGAPDDPAGALRALIDKINNAPTVDADIVRHGEWLRENIRPKSYLRVCSMCKKTAYFCGKECSYKFCPHCGAKMEGDPTP